MCIRDRVNGVPREDHFQITVASEIMAILCLADDLVDLKARLGRILGSRSACRPLPDLYRCGRCV